MKSILVTFIILAIQTLSALAQCFTEVQKYDSSDIETFFTRRFRLIKTVTIDYNAAADTTIRYYESYVEKSRLKYTFTDFGEGTSREFEVFCPGVTIAEFYPILQRLDKNFKMFNLKDSCKTIKKQKYYPQSKQYYTNEYIFKP